MKRVGKNTRSTPARAPPRVDTLEPRRLLAAQLVADLTLETYPARPERFVSFGQHAYFFAEQGPPGPLTLYRTDGAAGGTLPVKSGLQYSPGRFGYDLVSVAGMLLYTDRDAAGRTEMWASDGTPQGTRAVGKFSLSYGQGQRVVAFAGKAFFAPSEVGSEIWSTDGTPEGTTLAVRLPDASSVAPWLTVSGGRLYFIAKVGDHYSLMRTDGTQQGTTEVRQFGPNAADAPILLTDVAGTLFFQAREVQTGYELWRSDGTPQGTYVLDVAPGGFSSNLNELTAVENTLFYRNGGDLWKSDGTLQGTVPVLPSPPTGFSPMGLTAFDDVLLFSAWDPQAGREPWRSDGTPQGTYRIKDTAPGPTGAITGGRFTPAGGAAYYAALMPANQWELWRTDGTSAGTGPAAPLPPSAQNSFSNPYDGAALPGGRFVFEGPDLEPWITSGQLDTAHQILDLNSVPVPATIGAVMDLGQVALFGHNRTLYKTDGTPAGTSHVADVMPVAALGLGATPSLPTHEVLDGVAIFAAATSSTGLYHIYRSDGTPQGTFRLTDLNLARFGQSAALRTGPFIRRGGLVYFTAQQGEGAGELWRTDGTPEGTLRLTDASLGPVNIFGTNNSKGALGNGADAIYFVRRTSNSTLEMWRTDGTVEGTRIVREFASSSSSISGLGDFFPAGGRTMFVLDDHPAPPLWTTDGTPEGTVPIARDLHDLNSIFNFKGLAYFRAIEVQTPGFYRSDGTDAGTVKLDLPPPVFGSNVAVAGDYFYYVADNADGAGAELWRSDGTPAGTRRLADIRPGAATSDIRNLVAWRGAVYFSADDGTRGREVWRSDGTPQGTVIVQDLYPGPTSSSPGLLSLAGGQLYFAASTPEVGRELFKVIDDVPPRATHSDPSPRHPAEFQLRFSEPILGLDATDFVLRPVPNSPGAPTPSVTLAFDPATGTYTVAPQDTLPDGNYRLTLPADINHDFFVLAADANHDRAVNFPDLVLLAQNYGQSSTTWQQADFTGDAKTDFQDLVLLAQRYNTTLPPPPAAATLPSNKESAAPVSNTAAPIRPTPPKKPAPKSRTR